VNQIKDDSELKVVETSIDFIENVIKSEMTTTIRGRKGK